MPRIFLLIAVFFCASPAWAENQEPEEGQPFETGFVERTGITLMFLDVEVTDEQGMPVQGLTKDDFEIQVNRRFGEIYSVDDLCSCPAADEPGEMPPRASETRSTRAVAGPPEGPLPAPTPERVSYVLYFDFGQLRQDGREHAVAQAKRWVREVMGPDDQAMVAAYASLTGLRQLCRFTSDKAELVGAIERGFADPELRDPFPILFQSRLDECSRCCANYHLPCRCGVTCCESTCKGNADKEYFHGQRSLKGLIALLGRLESRPGRKSLLMFHQNGSIYPSRFYPGGDAGDHAALLETVGAEATLSRTVVNVAYTGGNVGPSDAFANFGANLAEYTGGRYNRGASDMGELVDGTVRDCRCTYRIGIRPPTEYKNRVFRIKVRARDRAVPYRYRAQFLDEVDRWWRRAQAVLTDPDSATDVTVSAALMPRQITGKGWDLTLQVGLDLDSLMLYPSAGKQRADWEVGALLYKSGGGADWEMLGRSKARVGQELKSTVIVLHQRTFEQLKPGEYHLAAFVRDRSASAFGGAEVVLTLPKRDKGGLVGPFLMRPDGRFVSTTLPLLEEKADSGVLSGEVQSGPVPVKKGLVPRGTPLDIVTWFCGGQRETVRSTPTRFVSRDGAPLFRFEGNRELLPGPCSSISDRVQTMALEPGAYAYHLKWDLDGTEDPVKAEIGFEVTSP